MFKKILLASTVLFSSFIFINKDDTFAATDDDNTHSLLTCYNSPRTKDSSGKTKLQKLIASGEIKGSITVTIKGFYSNNTVSQLANKTLYVDEDLFYERHMVIYNGKTTDYTATLNIGQKFDGRKVCNVPGKRYLGFDERGYAVVDPLSIPDVTSSRDYFLTRQFLFDPSSPKSFWSKLTKAQRGTKPNPILIGSNVPQGTGSEKRKLLERAVDTFQFGIATSRTTIVDFKGRSPMTLKKLRGNLDKNNIYLNSPLGKHLHNYAVMVSVPSKYTPGTFYLYTKIGKGSYRYSSNFILQEADPFSGGEITSSEVETLDVASKVILPTSKGTKTINGVSYPVYDAKDFNPSVKYSMTYKSSIDYSMKGKCSSLAVALAAGNLFACKSNSAGEITSDPFTAGIRIYPINEPSSKKVLDIRNAYGNTLLNFTLDKNNKSKTITLNEMLTAYNKKLNVQKSGLYVVKSFVPYYMLTDGTLETTYGNNRNEVVVYLNGIPNVSLSGSMSSNFPAGAAIDTKLTVKNDYNQILNDKITYKITNQNGVEVVKDTIPYSDLAVDASFTTLLKEKNITLAPNDYTLEASIPIYDDEGNKKDNSYTKKFSVDMFIPENTVCDFVNNANMKTTNIEVLKYASKGKAGVSRTCIGYLPHFPSTVVEDGQKTFFYVAYRALPFPIPSYRITNLDIHGVKQQLIMKEPRDAMGSCNASANEIENNYSQTFAMPYTALSNCTLKDTFYYFPSSFNGSIKDVADSNTSNAAKDWLGPYELGAYDYFHYAYRGRLVPNKITLDVKVYDPEFNVISFENNIGLGNLTFYMEKECFYLDPTEIQLLDIKDSCKLIQLYLPGTSTDNTQNVETYFSLPSNRKPYSIPDEKYRANFLNVGLHAITLDVSEEHSYIYQRDIGAEWQGKDGVLTWDGSKTVSGPINTTTMKQISNGSWVQNSKIPYNGTPSADKVYVPYLNHCYIFTNAIPSTGSWQNKKIFEKHNNYTCFHDSSSDFYYWMFNWSENRIFNNFYLFDLESDYNSPTAKGFTQKKIPGNDSNIPYDPGLDLSLPDDLSLIDDTVKNIDDYLKDNSDVILDEDDNDPNGLFEDEKTDDEDSDRGINEYIDHVEPPDSGETPYDGL